MKKSVILLLLIAGLSGNSQVNLDSLWNVWNDETQPDTSRAFAMYKIAWEGYIFSQPDSAYYYAQILYDFAEEKGVKKEMARALNIKGVSYYIRSDYVQAMHYYHQCLELLEEISDKQRMASIFNNMGLIYSRKGNYSRALDYYKRTLKIFEEFDDKARMAGVLNNIGVICIDQREYSKALEYFQRCLKLSEEVQNNRRKAVALNNLGIIYEDQGKFDEALESYQRSLGITEELDNKRGIANILNHIGVLYMNQGEFTKAMSFFERGLKIRDEMSDDRGLANSLCNIGQIHSKEGNHLQAISFCNNSLELAEELNGLVEQKAACLCLYEAYKALGNDMKALEYHEQIKVVDDSLKAQETIEKVQQMEFEREMLADSLLREEEKLKVQIAHEEKVRKKNQTRNIYILLAFLLLLFAIGFYRRMVYVRKAKKAVEDEKKLADKLLLNILPSEIADELKQKGRADARKFEKVTILFTDFKEFTQISEKLNAEDLVSEINTCFKRFDTICTKYGIEKIKTIGDSYMAAGGLPVPSDESVKNTVLAGIEMAKYMNNKKINRENEEEITFEMRVGIHSGPVVAGIVGVTKFQYDIWGDTVNTASRVERTGEVGKVNISQATYELIKDDPAFKFHSRGMIKTKGKGEIEMWFVERAS